MLKKNLKLCVIYDVMTENLSKLQIFYLKYKNSRIIRQYKEKNYLQVLKKGVYYFAEQYFTVAK